MKEKSDRSKNKILFIITGLDVGGAEIALSRLVRGLKEDFQIEIISLIGEGLVASKIRGYGVVVHELNFKRICLFPVCLYRFCSIVFKFSPDIIQGWMYHGNLLAYVAKLLRGKKAKLFLGIRQSLENISTNKDSSLFVIRLDSIFSKIADRIVYNSYAGKRDHEKYGYSQEKGIVVCNGFDIESFCPSTINHDLLCDEIKIDRNSFLIGIVGRFHPVKDHATFIHAAAILASTSYCVHFIMVGANIDNNNKIFKDLMRLYPGLSQRVHMLGLRNDMPYITSALDVATNCSLSEGFSNCLCEALSCGVICVVTDVGDSKRIIGKAGFVVPTNSPKELAAAWHKIMEMSKDERALLSVLSRKQIEHHYSNDTMTSKYKELIR